MTKTLFDLSLTKMNYLNSLDMTSADREALELFHNSVQHLLLHSLIMNDQLRLDTVTKFHQNGKIEQHRHEIDSESFESLLVRLRVFCNQKDQCYFNTIANIVGTYMALPTERKDYIRELKKMFANEHEQLMLFNFDGEGYIGSKEIIDYSFNGELFHKDKNKLEKIHRLRDLYGDSIQDSFVTGVIVMTNELRKLDKLVEHVLSHANRVIQPI